MKLVLGVLDVVLFMACMFLMYVIFALIWDSWFGKALAVAFVALGVLLFMGVGGPSSKDVSK